MRIRPMSSTLHRPRARMCAWTAAFLLLVVCASAASGPGAVRTEVQLVGFGTFAQAVRPARRGFNPHTRQPMKIPAIKTIRFKAGADLRELT